MSAKILLVEDEEDLRHVLTYNLRQADFTVETADTGEGALLALDEFRPDLVVLDWGLPGGEISGIEFCRRVRSRSEEKDLPIIMVTARGEEEDRIRGLDTGADDYLTKPISNFELIARIKAVLRRARPSVVGDIVRFGDITLNRAAKRVLQAGREIKLGPTEFRLLECFLKRPGRVLSREMLLDLVWGQNINVELRTVDVHVGRLRKALKEDQEGIVSDPIRTVRATGYGLNEAYAEERPGEQP